MVRYADVVFRYFRTKIVRHPFAGILPIAKATDIAESIPIVCCHISVGCRALHLVTISDIIGGCRTWLYTVCTVQCQTVGITNLCESTVRIDTGIKVDTLNERIRFARIVFDAYCRRF